MNRLVCAAMLCLSASFAYGENAVYHVSSDVGNDANEGSVSAPFKTIAKALEATPEGGEIRVAGGLYEEALVSVKSSVTLRGSYNADFTDRDLVNGRTVIKPPNTSYDCYTVSGDGVTSNVLSGVTLTGGRYGFCGKGLNQRDTPTYNALVQCVISNCTTGVWSEKCEGFVLLSCLIADNSEYGFYQNADTGGKAYVFNCTFSGNRDSAFLRRHSYCADRDIRNCVFVNNGTALKNWKDQEICKNIYLSNILWYGNVCDIYCSKVDFHNDLEKFEFNTAQFHSNPRIDARYAPLDGSPCIGAGLDLSQNGIMEFGEDLYGNQWGVEWGLGCVKGTGERRVKYSEVYVSPDGNDDNDGNTPQTAKSSVNEALASLTDGGVCHIADGTYTECVMVSVTNATLIGESRDGVVIQPSSASTGAVGYDLERIDFAVGVFNGDVTISNMTFRNGFAGAAAIPGVDARNTLMENCKLAGNYFGFMHFKTNASDTDWRLRLSHCIVSDNGANGASFGSPWIMDNCLVADNANYGVYVYSRKIGYMLNVTVTGNGADGLRYYDGGGVVVDNSIFEGNGAYGVYGEKYADRVVVNRSCFYGNASGDVGQNDERAVALNDLITGNDPLLDATSALRGRIGKGSPCAQAGYVYESRPVAIVDDLNYAPRIEGKVDVGCYISFETMLERAGSGYHILSVEGYPNGYGTPNPGYGANLLSDGDLALDFSGMLATSSFDGKRVAAVSEDLRAVYRGYEYIPDGGVEPSRSSDSEETLVLPGWAENGTLRLKWTLQHRVTASVGGAEGCMVSVAGCTPGACVTNWVDSSSTYTVEFFPSPNHSFVAWGGDFPENADGRLPTTLVVSDRPLELTALVSPILHVSDSSGDDSAADGTRAKPFKTINAAIAKASSGMVIRVQSGVYRESVLNESVDELTLSGGWNENWERDLRSAQSFVIPPSANQDCISLGSVAMNTVSGFVLAGGRYGVYMTGVNDSRYRVACVNNLTQLIVTNNAAGIAKNTNLYCGLRAVSCLVANNAGNGIYWKCDNKANCYIHNCTVVGNGGHGIHLDYGYSEFDVRNTIAANNGKYNVFPCKGEDERGRTISRHWFGSMCISGGATGDFAWNESLVYLSDGVSGAGRLAVGFTSHVYFTAPLLDDGFAPRSGSACIATGDDMSRYALFAELEDLYGEPWNGVYNIGCIAGGGENDRLSDVFVSPNGDDSNDGKSVGSPLKSIQKALLTVAENGTVHLAKGIYDECVCISVKGVTLRGAGASDTIVRSATAAGDSPRPFTLFAAADGIVIEGLSATGAFAGLMMAGGDFARNMTVRNCAFYGNTNGVFAVGMKKEKEPDGSLRWEEYLLRDPSDRPAPDNVIENCRMTDNLAYGFYSSAVNEYGGNFNVNVLNSLFARNGLDGAFVSDNHYLTSRFVYCTFAKNGRVGLTNSSNLDGDAVVAVNCLVAYNGSGVQRAQYGDFKLHNSLISQNGVDLEKNSRGTIPETVDCSFENPGFAASASPHNRYRPSAGSPAVGLAKDLSAEDFFPEPAYDLTGIARRQKVVGCFTVSPPGLSVIIR